MGIDRFLLVQWLAPLASEAPEFIIAIIFAARGKGTAAIATLISSKVNQWTLLMGSLPIAYMAGGGGTSLVLDGRQIEEVLLTATQTMMGVALILALRFHRYTAWALLALFVVQFPITSTHGRLILCGVYAVRRRGGADRQPQASHADTARAVRERFEPRGAIPAGSPELALLRGARDGQWPRSNSIGSVIGPLIPVNGFHGAGPVRRGVGHAARASRSAPRRVRPWRGAIRGSSAPRRRRSAVAAGSRA